MNRSYAHYGVAIVHQSMCYCFEDIEKKEIEFGSHNSEDNSAIIIKPLCKVASDWGFFLPN